jgi:hypothetical protein
MNAMTRIITRDAPAVRRARDQAYHGAAGW